MVSKDASFANNSQLDRMGALAKWIAAKAEEMAQLDRKIERRLDHMQRSEDNLRAMFEAIREQVAAAHTVSDELQKRTASANERDQSADDTFISALERASTLVETVEFKTRELQEVAQSVIQGAVDRLVEITEQTRLAQAAAATPQPMHQSKFEADSAMVQSEFEQRSALMIESIRRSAVEQIERLASQAAVAVDPILSRVEAQRQQAEAQLSIAMVAAEDTLRRRAEELGRTGDIAVDMLEKRLARRLENVRPRTIETLDAAEQSMNQRLTALIDGAKRTIAVTETDLTERVAQISPRISQTLQGIQDDLGEQLARLEEHAFAMTGWLDQRMGDRVDALIARTRAALSHTPTNAVAPLSAEAVSLACYADEYPAPASPNSVDVQVFVDRRTDRIYRSTSATIFQ